VCVCVCVCVQEFRWEKEGMVQAGDYNFFFGKVKENRQLGTESLYTSE